MRGIVRGFQGAFGGLGVFTKCAIKLYKWNGPREWKFEGKSPKYILTKFPERSALNALAFPSRAAEKDAGCKMGEVELNHGEFRTPMFFAALGLTDTKFTFRQAALAGQTIYPLLVAVSQCQQYPGRLPAISGHGHHDGCF